MAGCATGEEAYSLGMLISEVLGHPLNLADRFKIFATDIDEESLAVARRATYPAADGEPIPDGLRDRFVTVHEGELTIRDSLRRCLVFARHNIAEDPPFPQLDLISCRNTLIYFNPPLQKRALAMFHTGLVPGGLLFLGPSESPRASGSAFTTIDSAHNIFQRSSEPRRGIDGASRTLSPHPPATAWGVGARPTVFRDHPPEEHTATLEALVRSRCHPCVVMDDNHELAEVIGDVAPYCRLPEGRVSKAATAFLLPELQAEARALVLLARAEGEPVRSRPLALEALNLAVRLEARPLWVQDRQLTVLSFLPVGDGQADTDDHQVRERDADLDREIARLECDLLSSQESQRSSMVQLEAANQELEASAEELQAFSEELQSANEELQASNLELVRLNQQLRVRSEQLQAFTADLEKIQNSLIQGMVIVDQAGKVTRYTPLAVRVFGLVAEDIGRPLHGCPTTLPLPGLQGALQEVLNGAPRRVIEAVSEEVAYLVQVLPYTEQDGQQRGAIISLTDVSELHEMYQAAEASLGDFASLTDTLDQAVWKRDISLRRLLYASLRFLPLTGWSPAELFAQPDLLDAAIDPDDRERVQAARDLRRSGWSVTYRLRTRDGRRRWVTETARVVDDGRERSVVGTLSDITDQRESEQDSQRLALLFETLISSPRLALAVLDPDRRVVRVNDTLCALLGFDRASLLGSPASLFCVLPPLPEPAEPADPLPAGDPSPSGPPLESTLPLLHRNGSTLPLPAQIWRLPAAAGSRILMLILPPPASQS